MSVARETNFLLVIKDIGSFFTFVSLIVLLLLSNIIEVHAEETPIWLGNDIGKEHIVLPGYTPITVTGNNINLGSGRHYSLGDGLIFEQMESRDSPFVLGDLLLIEINGKKYSIRADDFRFLSTSQHHVEIEISGGVKGLVEIKLQARVEYDGIVMVDLVLNPLKPVVLGKLYYSVDIASNEWTRMLAYKAETIHKRQKKAIYDIPYRGEFLNAISIVDGNRSFWWFSDNAEGWFGDIDDVTEVKKKDNVITITQKVINRDVLISDEKKFTFNLMVTPVKEAAGNTKQNRHARRPTKESAEYQGLNVWWLTAFSHQVLPYTDYPSGIDKKITKNDLKVYPGLKENRKVIDKYKSLGIDRLPYFSAHLLSQYDPYYREYLPGWEVYPKKGWHNRPYDKPFTGMRDESYLTHRGKGYTDYLIYRFSKLTDELGFEGLYFDQGGVVGSNNPLNGLWFDDENNKRSSSEILAMREFHKRLATMLHLKGKKSLIYSHNSNTAVLPAYSFVTAMVQGEEYQHWLKDYDYIKSLQLDEVRTRLGSGAFGIPTVWLEMMFAKDERLDHSKRPRKMSKQEWLSSEYYLAAYNNFMALALLHDMPSLAFAPVDVKNGIYEILDWVEPESSSFTGYWSFPENTFNDQIYYSHYVSSDKEKILLILSNLSEEAKTVDIKRIITKINTLDNTDCGEWGINDSYEFGHGGIVNAKSFSLIQVVCN